MNETLTKSNKLTAVYARVSTARQEEDGTIETQLGAVREYAKKNGLTIVKEYIDDGWSGDNIARPALDSLRQEVDSKLWEAVLIYDPDRLARRYSYQALIMEELQEAGIEIIFVTVPAPKDDEERIMMGFRGLFAQYERTKINERFRLGKLRKIKEGHILVSSPLYGYNYIPKKEKEHGYYEINEEEARVVRMIFKWIANEGLTIRQVVRKLQTLGIKPRKSKRGVWSTSTLTTMLRNGAYVGKAHYRSSVAVVPKNPINKDKYRKMKKSSRKPRPADEWMTVPVPAIIDQELFGAVRTRLDEHAKLNPRNKKYDYLLGGRVECSCGRKRTGAARRKGKYLYYDCSDKILCFPLPRTCFEHPINARVADEMLWNKLASLMTSPDMLEAAYLEHSAALRADNKEAAADIPLIEKEIGKLRTQEERYNKAYAAGLYSLGELQNYIMPVREQISALETQKVGALQQEAVYRSSMPPTREEIECDASRAREYLPNLKFSEKREIVLEVVEKIVGTQEQLRVRGRIPITTLYSAYGSENRHRGAAQRGEVDALQRAHQAERAGR